MAHFYGGIKGNRGEATRLGTAKTGLTAFAASWKGSVQVTLWEEKGVDFAEVRLSSWHGAGCDKLLYRGPVSGKEEAQP